MLFNPRFHIPLIGGWDALGFLRFFAVAVLCGHLNLRDSSAALRAQGIQPRVALLRLAQWQGLADPLRPVFLVIFTYAFFRGLGQRSR